ncbi:MAG: chloride channel protein, partial [Clostridia bacterium]|nr:chloride channel protein [Clostridia bacterium]
NPAFIPLLFLALAVGAIVIGGVLKFIPMIRGSGIPQTEGATRGLIRYKWYQVLPAMFACSLFTIFMGLSAGSEGPSIMIGGASGCGVSDVLKRNATVRRYSITGGACAGLAVAFNAPLTGMAFAFEEAHKRFTPEVFVCAFSSVIFAILTRNLLGPCVGVGAGATFTTFVFDTGAFTDYKFYGFVLFAAIICALVAVGFYFLLFLSKKVFVKITFFKGMGKFLIPFLVGGAFALITVNVMGGGHEFIQSLGSWETVDGEKVYRGLLSGVEAVFSSPLWATLFIVVVLKLILTVLNLGAGVPCGIFIPMLAIGAGLGALLSLLCVAMGMPEAYADILVMVCRATFFTTVVKAPITGIVMVVELTWNFTFLLPAILGVAVGYLLGDLFRTEPLYDKLLDGILEGEKKEHREITARLRVTDGSLAVERAVRDVLW